MAATDARLRALVAPIVDELDLELFDVERTGGKLIVTIDKPGGVDIDAIAKVTRALSHHLDETEPIDGRYVLEVTSPGLERPLRTPDQYRWAIGKQVSLRVASPDSTEAGERRVTGTLVEADDHEVAVRPDGSGDELVRLAHGSIQKGRTVVDWDAELRAGTTRERSTPNAAPKGSAPTDLNTAAGDPETKTRPATPPGPSRRDRSSDGADDKRVSNR